jgi:alkanesulfonate monooxygenase SsuD/methylene tetrahydromethanopterin reductase-like flavin-dependent oxidoreductase (luciferase family)
MSQATLRFGVSVPNFGAYGDVRVLAALAQQAEAAGWDGFFIWDHLLFGPTPVVDAWVALTAIALQTERIRIGPMVTPLPRRRPVKLTRETVTLDHLSRGRLILSVGLGGGPWEWEMMGEETDLRTRAAMLDEGLEVLTGLWSGQPFRHVGEHYRVEGDLNGDRREAQFLPPALQQPRIPIWVAAAWPNKAPLRRAARWDGVNATKANLRDDELMSPEDLRPLVSYTSGQRASDAPFDVTMGGFTQGNDRARDEETVGPYAEVGLTWWIESVTPWRFGWQNEGAWPVELMNERIRLGPPLT